MLGAEVRKNLIAPRRQARKEIYLLVSRTWRALRLCASHLLPLSSWIHFLLAFGLERNVLLTKPF